MNRMGKETVRIGEYLKLSCAKTKYLKTETVNLLVDLLEFAIKIKTCKHR